MNRTVQDLVGHRAEVLRIAKGICAEAEDTVWISPDDPRKGLPETAVDALITLATDMGATEAEIQNALGEYSPVPNASHEPAREKGLTT